MRARAVSGLVAALFVLGGCVSPNQDRPERWLGGAQIVYPEEARAAGIEGQVTVRYRIRSDGSVDHVEVVTSDPPGVFDDAAVLAVRTWRYQPATVDGKPVDVPNVISTLRFSLDDSKYAGY